MTANPTVLSNSLGEMRMRFHRWIGIWVVIAVQTSLDAQDGVDPAGSTASEQPAQSLAAGDDKPPPVPSAKALDSTSRDQLSGRLGPGAAAGGPLAQPKHWSYRPATLPGVQVVWSRFIQFDAPQGRTVNAKVFMQELHPVAPVRAGSDAAPAAGDGKNADRPVRIACIGYEIEVDEAYAPDFRVPVRYVQQQAPGRYLVSFGALECFVQTTDPAGR
jgi:hypothetical protein